MLRSLSPTDHQPSHEPGLLDPPTFTLRTLWCLLTILCGLFALLTAVGPVWALGLAFFGLLTAGHVLGNLLGTRLRSRDRSAPGAVSGSPMEQRRPAVGGCPRRFRTGPSCESPSHLVNGYGHGHE
ncbi:MAG: hypothetical protein ACC645_24520 [Pirellulales bacterium]